MDRLKNVDPAQYIGALYMLPMNAGASYKGNDYFEPIKHNDAVVFEGERAPWSFGTGGIGSSLTIYLLSDLYKTGEIMNITAERFRRGEEDLIREDWGKHVIFDEPMGDGCHRVCSLA